ncbi:MAG: hypothetical protein ACI8RZ_000697 [Myxococcota bacterium]|jgi:hypothetical protein
MRWLNRLLGRPESTPQPPPLSRSADPEALIRHRLGRLTWSARVLAETHPSVLHHPNKVALSATVPGNDEPDGTVGVSRFEAIPLPRAVQLFDPPMTVTVLPGFSPYPPPQSGIMRWHLNFAHHDLFCAYGDAMFAQDEIQVAEHPILASVREALSGSAEPMLPWTCEHGAPTPVLITGAARRLSVALTDSDGRSLYGHRFSAATPEQVREAVTVHLNPTPSNILAIEAPVPTGGDRYTSMEIEHALLTAYSGFRAAVLTTREAGEVQTVVHTGRWGCGAYGGDPTLMVAVQLIAASLAGVDALIVSTGRAPTSLVADLHARLSGDFALGSGRSMGDVRKALRRLDARWGVSDGN